MKQLKEGEKVIDYIFWCVKCLKDASEGEVARVHPDGTAGTKPNVTLINSTVTGSKEWEMECPHCGGDSFHVNICSFTPPSLLEACEEALGYLNSCCDDHDSELVKRLGQAIAEAKGRQTVEEICCECGKSVACGSGRFVNRVLVFDSYEENVDRNVPYPEGEYICDRCWHKSEEELSHDEQSGTAKTHQSIP